MFWSFNFTGQLSNKIDQCILGYHYVVILLLFSLGCTMKYFYVERKRCSLKYCSTFASDGWLPTLLERWLWMLIDLTPSSCLDEFLLSTFLSRHVYSKSSYFLVILRLKLTITFKSERRSSFSIKYRGKSLGVTL